MAKAILISIKPKYVADILNGKKTIEIRKSMPKCDLPIDVYIYCTKNKDMVCFRPNFDGYACVPNLYGNEHFNGKIVAKFTLNTIWKYKNKKPVAFRGENKMILYQYDDLQVFGCISLEEINQYCNGNCYTWHIDNLEIFDTPKEISEFMKVSCKGCPFENTQTCHNNTDGRYCKLTRAPQSWQFIEV